MKKQQEVIQTYAMQVKQDDYRFRMRFSRFKVWLSFKDGHNKTFYASEASCTVAQINNKRVTEFFLDRPKGLAECIRIVEKSKHTGKYKTAIIYDRYHHRENGKWKEAEIRKYLFGNLVESEDPKYNGETKPRFRVIHTEDGLWNIEYIPTPTQFKQLVTQALNTSISTTSPDVPGVTTAPTPTP